MIVWFVLTWSLELYQQANARLYRQGQEGHVIVNHIIARGTIDKDVMRVLQKKEGRQEDLFFSCLPSQIIYGFKDKEIN